MSTHEQIFAAMQDAINAFIERPILETKLKTAADDRDFAQLELAEARSEIDRLRATVCKLEDEVSARAAQIDSLCSEIGLLRSAKDASEDALRGANHVISDIRLANSELSQRVEILAADKVALAARLEDSRGYGSRLAEMLKGFGSAIQSAVAEPAVSADAPFPAPNPVGMPVSSELKSLAPSLNEVSPDRVSPVDLAPAERVEPLKEIGNITHEDVGSQAERPDTSYPILPPREKMWWEN